MGLKNILKRQSNTTKIQPPKSKDIYAVQTGDFAGEMLIFVEKTNNSYCFLSIPNMVNREIPIDKYEFGIQNNILEKVQEVLPKQVYELCIAQYKQNKKNK